MSTKQPTLGDYETREEPEQAPHERALAGRGAEYGQPSSDASRRRHGPQNECRNCGASVSRGVGRVVGDEDGCVPVCGECHPQMEYTIRAVSRYYSEGGE